MPNSTAAPGPAPVPVPTPVIPTQTPAPAPAPAPTDCGFSCDEKVGTSQPADGNYYLTVFGCWESSTGVRGDPTDNCVPGGLMKVRQAGLCPWDITGAECEVKLIYYTAGGGRWPFLSRLQITNPENGKTVIAIVIDSGPACWVEQNVNHAVIDVSWPVSLYLFGVGHGWKDLATVHVEQVDVLTELGPTDDQEPSIIEPIITAGAYFMKSSVRNGINVRAKPSSDSQLIYMLEKSDTAIYITEIDGEWGYVDTGFLWTSGWVYLGYLDRKG